MQNEKLKKNTDFLQLAPLCIVSCKIFKIYYIVLNFVI